MHQNNYGSDDPKFEIWLKRLLFTLLLILLLFAATARRTATTADIKEASFPHCWTVTDAPAAPGSVVSVVGEPVCNK